MTAAADPLPRVRQVAAAAAATLDASRRRIDDLNVYPVPDGDTGTNLSNTVAAVVEALAGAEAGRSRARLAKTVAVAALMGAKGNSGIILSQIVRGLCDALATASRLDAATLARALRSASDTAYRAVRQPVEGTILTVVRELAEEAQAASAGPLDAALERILRRGEAAVARTPELLSILRDAGVVDAGGAGLLEILRGAIAGLRGQSAAVPPAATGERRLAHAHGEPSRYRYCTSYVVAGAGVDPVALERVLEPLGDCLIVVGDAEATKVHVHTDDPGRALSHATAIGAIAGVEIADMHAQIDERSERLSRRAPEPRPPERRTCDVVCVVVGDGNAEIARSLGARGIVAGGQSMNPSTGDLVEAIDACQADGVVVLPNNGNVLMAAAAAVAESRTPAIVVETRSIPAGLSALVAYDPEQPAEVNAAAMREATAELAVAEVTRAVRTATVDGIQVRAGSYIGLVDDRVVISAEGIDEVVAVVAARLLDGGRELLTVLTGAGNGDEAGVRRAVTALTAAHPEIEVEVREGGQPHYPLLLSAE